MPQSHRRKITKTTKILLVEDCPADAQRVRRVLSEARGAMEIRGGLFSVEWIGRLDAALEALSTRPFNVVLLSLQISRTDGLKALARLRAAADVPIVVLTDYDDDGLALAAIRRGAQDYVAKDRLDGRLLRRTLRHAVERHRGEAELLRHAREVEAARARIEQQAHELRQRAEQLDRINRELDDFTYIASHDLKEPLRGINAYCDILLEDYHDKLDDDGQRRLHTLGKLCGRLETLIDDLLTYCRVGGTCPAQTGIDLGRVVEDVLETLCPAIEQRGATVRVAGPLPPATGDATLIGMVIGNLISNGMKFNENRQACIEIGCLAADPPTLYVRDNGIGIEPCHHDEIFSIFRRLHSRKQYEGSGAGLTIVRKIVESHGGRIWLESQPGVGTTFFFTLAPAKESPSPQPVTGPPHWIENAHQRREVTTG
ncbi:MAG: response regulator [Candidatus Nealsonbacteria bacterium]|nr:response regulator [Candidatus Nealsonbacteria bacterium]